MNCSSVVSGGIGVGNAPISPEEEELRASFVVICT
jgi:hypothetical protein